MIFKISGLIVIIGVISFFHIKSIYKNDGIKAALVYALFMSIAALVGALLTAGFQLEGQTVIDRLFEPIGKAVLGS